MVKNVVVIYRVNNWDKEAPIRDPKYLEVAEDIIEIGHKNSLEIYHASIKWFKKGVFKKAFVFKNGEWCKVKNVEPNLIWLKMKITPKVNFIVEELNSQVPFLNPLPFERLNNKSFSSKVFYRWSPKTVKVNSYSELKRSFDVLGSKKVVVKPIKGSGGKGVEIINKKQVVKFKRKKKIGVAQKFIDSSYGIKGLCKGYHDLRLVFLNNKLSYSYIREPKRGHLLANIAQGGKMTYIPKNKIPKRVMKIANEIVGIIKYYNAKYYTLDFLLSKDQRPYLLEMNTMPGAYFNPSNRKEQLKFFKELIDTINLRIKEKRIEQKRKK